MSAPVTSFRGLRALLLHRQDHNRDALESQLRRIGLLVTCAAPLGDGGLPAADVIFFDADLGYEGLFPWDRNEPPVPLVAVLASEAPGRLEWALDQGATSYLLKPIGSVGAFNALVVAWRLFSERRDSRAALSDLSERVRARPIVVRAALEVMHRLGVTDERALTLLRQAAMRERITVEALCARIAAGGALASLMQPQAAVADPLHSVQRRSLQRRQK
jgi:AmiR/NasT family two-component response regulator